MAYELGNSDVDIEVFKTLSHHDISVWWDSVTRPMSTEEQRISEEILNKEMNDALNNQMIFGGYGGYGRD